MNTKRILAVLLALAMIFSMAACTNSGETTPEPSGEGEATEAGTGPDGRTYAAEQVYRTLYSSEMTTMNYLVSGTTYELEVGANTIDSLVENDTYGNIVPCAAESWEESEDGLTWTFHLRPDQLWYDKDGNEMAPVTANDYVAAARYVCDSANDCGNSYLMDGWLVNATELLEYTAAKLVAVPAGTEGEDDEYVVDDAGVIYAITDNGYEEVPAVAPEDLGVVAVDDLTLEYHLECKESNISSGDLFFTPSHQSDSTLTLTADAGGGRKIVFDYLLGKDYMLHFKMHVEGMEGLFSPKTRTMDIFWREDCKQQERGHSFENRYATLTY